MKYQYEVEEYTEDGGQNWIATGNIREINQGLSEDCNAYYQYSPDFYDCVNYVQCGYSDNIVLNSKQIKGLFIGSYTEANWEMTALIPSGYTYEDLSYEAYSIGGDLSEEGVFSEDNVVVDGINSYVKLSSISRRNYVINIYNKTTQELLYVGIVSGYPFRYTYQIHNKYGSPYDAYLSNMLIYSKVTEKGENGCSELEPPVKITEEDFTTGVKFNYYYSTPTQPYSNHFSVGAYKTIINISDNYFGRYNICNGNFNKIYYNENLFGYTSLPYLIDFEWDNMSMGYLILLKFDSSGDFVYYKKQIVNGKYYGILDNYTVSIERVFDSPYWYFDNDYIFEWDINSSSNYYQIAQHDLNGNIVFLGRHTFDNNIAAMTVNRKTNTMNVLCTDGSVYSCDNTSTQKTYITTLNISDFVTGNGSVAVKFVEDTTIPPQREYYSDVVCIVFAVYSISENIGYVVYNLDDNTIISNSRSVPDLSVLHNYYCNNSTSYVLTKNDNPILTC